MIIGTITLISMLFFGGVQEYFLLDKLEKGVKKYVEDKDRRKEILADLKASKNVIKIFNKDRKIMLKSFKKMSLDRNAKQQDFKDFFNETQSERINFQEKIIEDRLRIVEKFSPEEWNGIILLSSSSAEKRLEKALTKTKNPFNDLYNRIDKSITDTLMQAQIRTIIDDFENEFNKMTSHVKSLNASQSEILQNQMVTSEELHDMANTVNEVRKEAMNAFIDFHFRMKEVTNEKEWQEIMKEFNRILS